MVGAIAANSSIAAVVGLPAALLMQLTHRSAVQVPAITFLGLLSWAVVVHVRRHALLERLWWFAAGLWAMGFAVWFSAPAILTGMSRMTG